MDSNKSMPQSEDSTFIPMTSSTSGTGRQVRNDVYYYTNQIVNIVMIGNPENGKWVLVDAGMPQSGEEIVSAAAKRFGKGNKPTAILLTHGHFDHVGSLVHLINEWNIPVYAHPMEFNFMTGQQNYPELDTSVEGGLLAKISGFHPKKPVDIERVLHVLPEDGSVPELPYWKWLHTPGHSPGHVSFYREGDRTLISGDAFITVKQDSFYKVLVQKSEVQGPPRYLTTDWEFAWESVKKLEELKPILVIPGHGSAMEGEELREGLKNLAKDFDKIAIPEPGKFVAEKR
ncbi:MAG: MBL fold metallo-hydrolase [Balneolaceae bacterium]